MWVRKVKFVAEALTSLFFFSTIIIIIIIQGNNRNSRMIVENRSVISKCKSLCMQSHNLGQVKGVVLELGGKEIPSGFCLSPVFVVIRGVCAVRKSGNPSPTFRYSNRVGEKSKVYPIWAFVFMCLYCIGLLSNFRAL